MSNETKDLDNVVGGLNFELFPVYSMSPVAISNDGTRTPLYVSRRTWKRRRTF
jgi:hypothetical protein